MKAYFASHPLPDCLEVLPFNSGYFMSFLCKGISAEDLRLDLLNNLGIGTISMQDKYLRVAFSSVEEEKMADLLDAIFAVARSLA